MNNVEIIKIMKSFGFKTENDPVFGEVVMMNPEEGYIFSATTGAKYLIYQNGITMKGRSEVFIHRSLFSNGHLIYSPGLFSRDINGLLIEGNSANLLQNKYPDIFKGDKKVIICDIENGIPSNIESKIYSKIMDSGLNPKNYILYKNSLSNILGESLQEYFASVYFMNNGYLVENQVPWFQQNYKFKSKTFQGGIPDFSAFHCSFSQELYSNGFITDNKGMSLSLLPVIKLFRENLFVDKNTSKKFSHKLVIGEAKTSKSSLPQALRQLKKYNSVDIADELFTIIPNSKTNDYFGAMFINDDYKVVYEPKNLNSYDFDNRKNEDDNWLNTYIKMLLLGNISFEKILTLIADFRNENKLTKITDFNAAHLLDVVQNTDNNTFMEFIKENL